MPKHLGSFLKAKITHMVFFNCYMSANLTFAWIKKEDDNKNVFASFTLKTGSQVAGGILSGVKNKLALEVWRQS